jgi:hypothetical protein
MLYFMKLSFKRKLAYQVIKQLHISEVIRRLYPVAMDVKFENVSQNQIIEIMRFISVKTDQSFQLIRLGSLYDGGYLVVDDFSSRDILVSLGIGDNADFEYNISKRIERIIAFDHTVDSIPNMSSNTQFNKLGVKAKSVNEFITLSSIVADIPEKNDLLLKIDIEGSEWEVLDSMSDKELTRFRQIVGEFHGFNEKANFGTINRVLSKILQNFVVVHTHANNWGRYEIIKRIAVPDVIEISFLRKDTQAVFTNEVKNQKVVLNSRNNPSDLDIGFNLV